MKRMLAGRLAAVLTALALSLGPVPALAEAAKPAFNAAQEQAIRDIVKKYLLENPEVIAEAIEELRRKQQEEQRRAASGAIRDNRDALLRNPASPVGGNPEGDVTIVEFFDYRCGYCKRVKSQLDAVLKADPRVRVVFKEFPILGPDSVFAAQAALASREQGKYLEFHDALMAHEGDLTEEATLRIAADIGLDVARLQADMKADKITQALRGNMELASKLGVNGTPAFIIGDELIPGAIRAAQFVELLAGARETCAERKTEMC